MDFPKGGLLAERQNIAAKVMAQDITILVLILVYLAFKYFSNKKNHISTS
jgi:hypothetical protein